MSVVVKVWAENTNLFVLQSQEADTGAVLRCKPNRSQKVVMVQDFDCVQMRISGFNSHKEFVLCAGAKQKP
jgi:hypothetical protein